MGNKTAIVINLLKLRHNESTQIIQNSILNIEMLFFVHINGQKAIE